MDLVHAKMILGDDAVLFGSANLTNSGFADRFELSCISHDPNHVGQLSSWFEELWTLNPELSPENFADLCEEVSRREARALHKSERPTRNRSAGGTIGWMRGMASGISATRCAQEVCDREELARLASSLRRIAPTMTLATTALRVLGESLTVANLSIDDPRLHLNYASGISICINQRDVAWSDRSKQRGAYMGFIVPDIELAKSVAASISQASLGAFTRKHVTEAVSLYIPLTHVDSALSRIRESWHAGIRAEIQRGSCSSYLRHKKPFLYKVLTDGGLRGEVLAEAFPATSE